MQHSTTYTHELNLLYTMRHPFLLSNLYALFHIAASHPTNNSSLLYKRQKGLYKVKQVIFGVIRVDKSKQ